MKVIGFTGGRHCARDHGERLSAAGAHRVIAAMGQLPEAVRLLLS
jgi:hypothetical protein